MFGKLRKKLQEGVQKLSRKTEEKVVEAPQYHTEKPKTEPRKEERPPESGAKVKRPEPKKETKGITERLPEAVPELAEEEPAQEPREPEERKGSPEEKGRLARFRGIRERVTTRELSEKDIDDFFEEGETELLQSDVALEVMDALKEKLKAKLIRSKVKRGRSSDLVARAFEESILEIVDQGRVDLPELIRKARKEGRPLVMIFLGFNGSGKTTSIAKIASFLKGKGFSAVLAAGDSFRAAAIEQLGVHGERLGVKVIKHQYGSDSAAVIFDAREYAKKKELDVVLADTAGRAHTDRNLMDELRKVVRVNVPDLKVLVVDSLTGNDSVEQARQFNEAVGVDCVVMTKTDVNPRGGSILSVAHTIGKPILFLGTGQDYSNIEMFSPEKFVRDLMG